MRIHRLSRVAFHIAILVLIIVLIVAGTSTQATAQTDATPTSTATLDPAGLDPSSMTTFVSKTKAFEFQIPKGWSTVFENSQGGTFDYGAGATFAFNVGNAKALLGLPADVDSPQAAMDSWIKDAAPTLGWKAKNISDPFAVKTSQYEGIGVTYTTNLEKITAHWELWILGLTKDKVAVLLMGADQAIWEKAKPIFEKMVNSLILHPLAINTATPTASTTPDTTLVAILADSTMETYKSPDGVFELQLPTIWHGGNAQLSHPAKGLGYKFSVQTSAGESIDLWVEVGTAKDIYSNYQVTTNVANLQEALKLFERHDKTIAVSESYPVKIGLLDGYGIIFTITSKIPLYLATAFAQTQTPAPNVSPSDLSRGELWIASLGDDQVVVVSFESTDAIWLEARPILRKIAGSVMVHTENIAAAYSTLTATEPSK